MSAEHSSRCDTVSTLTSSSTSTNGVPALTSWSSAPQCGQMSGPGGIPATVTSRRYRRRTRPDANSSSRQLAVEDSLITRDHVYEDSPHASRTRALRPKYRAHEERRATRRAPVGSIRPLS